MSIRLITPDLKQSLRPYDPAEAFLSDIECFLRGVLTALAPDPAARRGRPRVLPALALWVGLVVCVLRGFSNQLAL